ncbi:hypothetical protein EEL34_12725 [Muribaculaceae bacterium Isolate-039 (Harlan)]|uniref:Uncharacterized protein n=2 Tax=Bacteria TaxID=2 RepID=A0A4P7W7E8_9BACT|nr:MULTISPECIES: hypothetical protein [Bacteroidales]MCE9212754.1 hypothetical protein [Bacteroides ovatus]QCD43520.1 hypothetical protein E7747_15415 [Duncaniella dubosii]ROS84734.1 hypothetical protein EEL34_12725 [Muribaculaceae bacterium Isolate-039 (Harlan)]
MRKIVLIISILLCVLSTCAQGIPLLKNLQLAELPKEISYTGEFLSCTEWADKLGENYLIISQSPVHKEVLPESTPISSKELYARHYIKDGEHYSILWQLYDFLKDGYCGMFSVDYLCEPYVNDFDRDGICETWLVYQLGCRSDFSGPNLTMKIIMHSGNKKYAIRGERDMLFPQSYGISPELGKFQMDDNYRTLPESVRNFGIALWHKFQVEDLKYLME